MKKLNKGFTLEVTSWENDGDYYATKFKTVETREEAKKLFRICTELFKSKNNGDGGVGNSMYGEGNQTILDYVENNIELFPDLNPEDDEDNLIEYFENIAYELMGNSECYDFRVCKSCNVTYLPHDIFLEEIKF